MEPTDEETHFTDRDHFDAIGLNLSSAEDLFQQMEQLNARQGQGNDPAHDIEATVLQRNYLQSLDDISRHAQELKARVLPEQIIHQRDVIEPSDKSANGRDDFEQEVAQAERSWGDRAGGAGRSDEWKL